MTASLRLALDTLRKDNAAASDRFKRRWVESVASMLRSGATDEELESFVRSIPSD